MAYTEPSGCSHVMVPVDEKAGCVGVPFSIGIDITVVQSYR